MKKLNILISFLIILKVGMAQTVPTFNLLFSDTAALLSGGVSITSFHDSIYFTLTSQGSPNNFQAMMVIKTDPSGHQCAASRFYRPDYIYSSGYQGSLRITTSGQLICGGSSGPLNYADAKGILFKFDRTTLDTIYTRGYAHGNASSFYGVNELSNENLLFSGVRGDTSVPYQNWGWMVETDTAGIELWEKSLTSDVLCGIQAANPFNGGFYQNWATAHYNTINALADSAVFLDKYDNSGNLQWRDTLGIVGNENVNGPNIGLREGGVIVIIDHLDTAAPSLGNGYCPMVIYKFDSNGSIIWQHFYPSSPEFKFINASIETRSGSLVMCGKMATGYVSVDTEGHDNGLIMKLDKDGNMLFKQVYNYDTSWEDELIDITETNDGGYACVGDAYQLSGNINYGQTWLLKVDSNGCLNGDCPTLYTGIHDIPNLAEFFVFPNPATSHFTVALAGPNDISGYEDLTFTLYDLTGRMVRKQSLTSQTTIITRDGLSDGLYVWGISDGSNYITNGKIALR